MSKPKQILIVVTSYDTIGTDTQTGIWFSEFAEPYEAFRKEGYDITVASIRGGKAPVDPRSLKGNPEWEQALAELEHTELISTINAEGYDALFLPGGHGTMFDLPGSPALQAAIRAVYESGGIVAAVCHGPAGLVDVTLSNGEPLVKGKRLTSFTDEEERAAKYDMLMPFLLEERLRQQGAQFIAEPLWSNHVETDGRLITGQNPQSSESVAVAIINALNS